MSKPATPPKKPKKRNGPKPGAENAGRPLADIKQSTFESLCAIQCTILETCAVLKVDDKTLNAWCERTYGQGQTFSEVFPIFAAEGNASIRRKQFQLAMAGNVKLLEILGQNRLGQVKKVKQTNDTTLHGAIIEALHGKQEEE